MWAIAIATTFLAGTLYPDEPWFALVPLAWIAFLVAALAMGPEADNDSA